MLRLGLQREEAPGERQQLATELGRRHLAPAPVEEPDPEALLQRLTWPERVGWVTCSAAAARVKLPSLATA